MRAWLELLGGLLIWAVHFLGLYGLASLADITPPATRGPYGPVTAIFTAACVLGAVVLAAWAWRKGRDGEPIIRFRARLATMGAALAAVAMVWQSVPAWWGFD